MSDEKNKLTNYQIIFNLLASNTSDRVILLDKNKKVVDINLSLLNEYHLIKSKIIGTDYTHLFEKINFDCPNLDNINKKNNKQIHYSKADNLTEIIWLTHALEDDSDIKYILIGKNSNYDKIINNYLQLNAMFEHMPCNVYWMNKDLIHMGCNNNVLNMLGLTREQYIGSTYEDLAQWANWPEGLADAFKGDDIKVLESGKAIFNVEEMPFYDANNNLLYLLSSRVPLRNLAGEVVGVAGISTNVTDLKQAQQKLISAIKQAEIASQTKTDFIANMSHDIRTPITGMLGLAQSLKDNAEHHDQQQDAGLLIGSTKELLKLLNDILEISKLDSGYSEDKETVFSIADVISHNTKLLEPAAKHKKLELITSIDKAIPPHLKGNRGHIDKILLNVMSNAIKFTEKGHVKITATLDSHQYQSVNLILSITDTGIGIAQDNHKKIFEHFTRLTPSYQGIYKGSGLGLYTVKRYLDQMGGHISMISNKGCGTTFTIMLPLTVGNKSELDTQTNVADEIDLIDKEVETNDGLNNTKLRRPAAKVLIVEDNMLAARMAGQLLRKNNCDVDIAETGMHAIEMIQKNPYNLVLMDIGLPDIDGITVARRLNQLNISKEMPIIALTGHIMDDKKQDCLNAGMQDLIIKPLSDNALQIIMDKYIFNSNNDKCTTTLSKSLSADNKKVIDLDDGTQLANGNMKIAREMIALLVKSLPSDIELLKKYYSEQDVDAMREQVHKMYGGLCYCGVPRLRELTADLQLSLARKEYDNLQTQVEMIVLEAEKVVRSGLQIS